LSVLPEEYGGNGPKADHDFEVEEYLKIDPYLEGGEGATNLYS
jgi:hypothetical protein